MIELSNLEASRMNVATLWKRLSLMNTIILCATIKDAQNASIRMTSTEILPKKPV